MVAELGTSLPLLPQCIVASQSLKYIFDYTVSLGPFSAGPKIVARSWLNENVDVKLNDPFFNVNLTKKNDIVWLLLVVISVNMHRWIRCPI